MDACTHAGRRKIVIATNVAETSLTIPDVVYVVDMGRAKEQVSMPTCSYARVLVLNLAGTCVCAYVPSACILCTYACMPMPDT